MVEIINIGRENTLIREFDILPEFIRDYLVENELSPEDLFEQDFPSEYSQTLYNLHIEELRLHSKWNGRHNQAVMDYLEDGLLER